MRPQRKRVHIKVLIQRWQELNSKDGLEHILTISKDEEALSTEITRRHPHRRPLGKPYWATLNMPQNHTIITLLVDRKVDAVELSPHEELDLNIPDT